MKFSWSSLFQIVAATGQVANAVGGFIPSEKGRLTAGIVVGAAQFLVSQYQKWHNPDGTRAEAPYIAPYKPDSGIVKVRR